MAFEQFLERVRHRLLKMRLHPIRVYCFHQVSDELDLTKSFECDWTETGKFKETILKLRRQYRFITLDEAFKHIKHDKFRFVNYAVLTSDDGYHSVLSVIPWLKDNHIPITLFVNAQYLDSKHFIAELYCQAQKESPELSESDFVKDLYITEEELKEMDSQWVSIGLHGYEHVSVSAMNDLEFESQLEKSLSIISSLKGFVPFYAYTFGVHKRRTDAILRAKGLVPVLMDGSYNINDELFIHRECVDKGVI